MFGESLLDGQPAGLFDPSSIATSLSHMVLSTMRATRTSDTRAGQLKLRHIAGMEKFNDLL
jgi:hypothetical protein